MKRIVLGDVHFGCRNDAMYFHEYQKKFFDVFLDNLEKSGIKRIYQLGDFMDRRKYVNFYTLNQTKKVFLNPLRELGVEMYVLTGNHDIYYRDSLEINSVTELFYGYENIIPINEPTTIIDEGVSIDIIPWICKENESEIKKFIDSSKSTILMGHLELAGFDMLKGVPSEHGADPGIFARYDQVFSGHYHTRSIKNNIQYLGTPYEITWSDCDDPKGYGILDLETVDLEFIRNPYKLHSKIIYDEDIGGYDSIDLSEYKQSFIKVIVTKKEDEKKFTRFIERLYSEAQPIDVSIIDTSISYTEVKQDVLETRDPLSILISSVDDEMSDASEIRMMIQELHTESLARGATEV